MKPEQFVWNAPKVPSPRSTPGELLCEFLIGHDRYRVEFRDHRTEQGVEAQVLKKEEFSYSRTFRTMDGTDAYGARARSPMGGAGTHGVAARIGRMTMCRLCGRAQE
jgi:hypothetical protein